MLLTVLEKKITSRASKVVQQLKIKWVEFHISDTLWHTVDILIPNGRTGGKKKTNQFHVGKHHALYLESSIRDCTGFIWVPVASASPALTVLPVSHMASSSSRLGKCLQLSSSNVSASGTSEILGSLLQLGCHIQSFTQPSPELSPGNLTMLGIVWPLKISGTLVQAHINLQHACKQAICRQCCQFFFLDPFYQKCGSPFSACQLNLGKQVYQCEPI